MFVCTQTCQVSRIWRETHAFEPKIDSHARKGIREQYLTHFGISQELLEPQQSMTYEITLKFYDKAISELSELIQT